MALSYGVDHTSWDYSSNKEVGQKSLLLTWINLNPRMDKWLYTQ